MALYDRVGVPEDSQGEVIGENSTQLLQNTPAFWRLPYHELNKKKQKNVVELV